MSTISPCSRNESSVCKQLALPAATLAHVLEFDEDIESSLRDVQDHLSVHVLAVWSGIARLLHIHLLMWRLMWRSKWRPSSDTMSLPRKFYWLDWRQRNQVRSVMHGWMQDIALRCNNRMILSVHEPAARQSVPTTMFLLGLEILPVTLLGKKLTLPIYAQVVEVRVSCWTQAKCKKGMISHNMHIQMHKLKESWGICVKFEVYTIYLLFHCSCQKGSYYCNYLLDCPLNQLLWVQCISMNLPDYYNNGEYCIFISLIPLLYALCFHFVNSTIRKC